ncbi:putative lipoprotein [Mycobacterium xenopi 4042]|uniref:Putative lipoprotein n=1 Tax=Mycobacterium xenopi 4042 TaxID=1299334 RepID=X8DDT0_MYCXE|nr:putative lipoprotein [Mycobacterium xenopi 4042]
MRSCGSWISASGYSCCHTDCVLGRRADPGTDRVTAAGVRAPTGAPVVDPVVNSVVDPVLTYSGNRR